jgi:hypothetical protein
MLNLPLGATDRLNWLRNPKPMTNKIMLEQKYSKATWLAASERRKKASNPSPTMIKNVPIR